MSYGFVLTTYNDSDQAVKAYKSLVETLPNNEAYKIVVVDGGSTKDHLKVLSSEIGAVLGPYPDLSQALNVGFYQLLGYQEDNIKNFIENGPSVGSTDYLFWIHTDCRFHDYNWMNKLIWAYKYCWPCIGRLGPATRNIDQSTPDHALRGGNQCPLMFSKEVIHAILEKHGRLYDTRYRRIGGYEDWHNGRELLDLGYGFAIFSLCDVWHQGAGIRFLRDTREDQVYNANQYFDKFNTWLQPGFELDLNAMFPNIREDFEKEFGSRVWYKEPNCGC